MQLTPQLPEALSCIAYLHALLVDGLLQLLAHLLQLVLQVVALLEQPRHV
jgi:hypothetical protein